MGKTGKQAARNADKKASKRADDDEPATSSDFSGGFQERAFKLVMFSCLVETAPQLKDLFQKEGAPAKEGSAKKEEEKENAENESAEADDEEKTKADATEGGDAALQMFATLSSRLTWCNVLGLGEPATGEAATKAWLDMKSLELDFGPRSKKRGNPAVDRILENVHNLMPQYFHVLLALMMLRAFLFRSFFACLPWLVGYQILSVIVPLKTQKALEDIKVMGMSIPISKIPVEKVPLDDIPAKFRVAGVVALHALVWLFFLYETLWRMYFYEKFLVIGLLAYHAYAVRPQGK